MSVDAAWDSAALAGKVCDALVASGKLREKPAFIRGDREKLLAKIFGTAKLDGAALAGMSGRQVEVAVRNATQGEAWVDDVQNALKGMLSEEAKNSTEGAGESAEMKALEKQQLIEKQGVYGIVWAMREHQDDVPLLTQAVHALGNLAYRGGVDVRKYVLWSSREPYPECLLIAS